MIKGQGELLDTKTRSLVNRNLSAFEKNAIDTLDKNIGTNTTRNYINKLKNYNLEPLKFTNSPKSSK
eukprot:CAMPEP_0116890288 /NCGR_PEP_ID=MMETSP0467-20121206/826_1 /TAXON_ID=283647 /ORGANISM="Mesodinium pulex, Strain SPMC105" /LENGTH=66 /DNA_ID=CAMNT_0004557897 /DNA_START=337 /DNA_END=537 /DNA_ORIENTATION=-